MFVLTIDQRSSRDQADRVPQLLALLSQVDAVLPFERTAGDEVQGLLDSADSVVAAFERVTRSGGWSFGLGVGPVDGPLPDSVRATRGPALLLARDAVEAAKKTPPAHCAVRAGDQQSAREVEALLQLLGLVLQRRTPAQWRVVDAVAATASRAQAAERLQVTVQAISKALLASADDVVRGVYPLLARLLDEADEGSRT